MMRNLGQVAVIIVENFFSSKTQLRLMQLNLWLYSRNWQQLINIYLSIQLYTVVSAQQKQLPALPIGHRRATQKKYLKTNHTVTHLYNSIHITAMVHKH